MAPKRDSPIYKSWLKKQSDSHKGKYDGDKNPNFGKKLGGEDCCQHEQGSYECQKIIGIVCSSFELPTDDTKRQVDRAKQL